MLFKESPQHSKTKVNKAASNIRDKCASPSDQKIVENWRGSHGYILNTFQATLRRNAKHKGVTVAQRQKRRNTIYDKLTRFPQMQLARMNDIAGCRLICDDIVELNKMRNSVLGAKFKHIRQNNDNTYDYISNPKKSGYRGIHDVYKYVSFDGKAQQWNGLLVELQYRTKVQHAWATAVEIAGSVTTNQPKFDRGDQAHIDFFRVCSEILARKFENSTSSLPNLDWSNILKKYADLEQKTGILNIFRKLKTNTDNFENKNNVIIVLNSESDTEFYSFKRSSDAIRHYFNLEKKHNNSDIVLVRSDSSDGVRLAFKNYFRDTNDFVSFMDKATQDN